MATIIIYNSNLHDKTISTFIGDHSDFIGIAFVDCWDFVGVAFVTVSVVGCVDVDGEVIPPFVILSGEKVNRR